MGANWSGSPVGTFNSSFRVSLNAAAGLTQVIAAPGAGLSLYLQVINSANTNVFAPNAAAGAATWENGVVLFLIAVPGGGTDHIVFPGGFRVGDNKPLQVNNQGGTTMDFSGTYTIGPTI